LASAAEAATKIETCGLLAVPKALEWAGSASWTRNNYQRFYLQAIATSPTVQNDVELENYLLESLRERAIAAGFEFLSTLIEDRLRHTGSAWLGARRFCNGTTTQWYVFRVSSGGAAAGHRVRVRPAGERLV
jgi:hypothetical protein